jgi:hypothetical protein
VRDRNTVCSAAHLLVDAGLLELPARTYDRRGYVNGLAYVLRVDAAYAVIARQEDLPFKSSTKKSSAVPAPARPLTPATMKFTQRATWEVTNEHLAAKERGEDVPDNLPDVSQAIGDWLTDHGATAAEADIRAALEHVDRQRRRQQPLPLMGLARRQAAARTTIGAVDTASDEARERCRVAAVEARDRRRVIEEQIRTEIAAAVAAQPAAAAVLRALVRPELDAVLRRCPGLTDRDRPVHEHHAIVERVLSSLRGQSVPDTIAALVARGA